MRELKSSHPNVVDNWVPLLPTELTCIPWHLHIVITSHNILQASCTAACSSDLLLAIHNLKARGCGRSPKVAVFSPQQTDKNLSIWLSDIPDTPGFNTFASFKGYIQCLLSVGNVQVQFVSRVSIDKLVFFFPPKPLQRYPLRWPP